MSNTQSAVKGGNPKQYFYYPAPQNGKPRVVIAGVVQDGHLRLGEARCHPGNKGDHQWLPKLQTLMELYNDGIIDEVIVEKYGPRMPIRPDQFCKSGGRNAALDRAKSAVPNADDYPGQEGLLWRYGPVAVIPIPQGVEKGELGKFFKQEVEKRYPKCLPKKKKGEAAPVTVE